MTRFKQRCLDAARDGDALARFWAAATGESDGIALCRVSAQPGWTVLADPEDNEFCAFPDPAEGQPLANRGSLA